MDDRSAWLSAEPSAGVPYDEPNPLLHLHWNEHAIGAARQQAGGMNAQVNLVYGERSVEQCCRPCVSYCGAKHHVVYGFWDLGWRLSQVLADFDKDEQS